MSSYRALKAKEIELSLLSLEERLKVCPRPNGEHKIVLERLEELLTDFSAELLNIQPVIEDPTFRSSVDYTVARISSFLSIVETQFIRGLMNPSPEELSLRAVFLGCARRLGLDWIEDMVVQSSGTLAIYHRLGHSLATPVLHVPPGLLDKVLSLPGVYHEFGHSVFACSPAILIAMREITRVYFGTLRLQLGPMQPAARQTQLERFKQAEDFWNERRLEELFCDLFAQYVSGCANVISMIDLSMAEGRPVFDMGDADYPPDAARVRVCAMMLGADQAGEDFMQELQNEWEEFARQFPESSPFRDACAETLLKQFGEVVFSTLARELPNVPKCEEPLPDVQDAFVPTQSLEFENAVQQSLAVLAWNRDNFESWWQDARRRLT
jgi:hypothetical protein